MQSLTGIRASATSSTRSALQPVSKRSHCSHRGKLVVAHDSKGDKSVEDVLAAANALLNNLQQGNAPTAVNISLQASIDELQGLGYVCDESGCVLVLPGSQDSPEGQPTPIKGLLSGSTWSLGMLEDVPEAEEGEEQTAYTATVAGPSWSIPLKPSELGSILTMLQQLRMMVADLDAKGQWLPGAGERPASRVKRESSHIEVKAGYAPTEPGFSVEFTFKSSRRSVTVMWPADVTAAVIVAIDQAVGATSAGSTGRLERVSATVSA